MCAASGLAVRTVTQSGYSMRYSIPYRGAAAASRYGDRVDVVWDVGRRVQRPLERFFEELLNAGRCEGQVRIMRIAFVP
jgi:hypothetical protein